MDILEAQNMIDGIKGQLETLLKTFDATLANIPEDVKPQISFAQADMNEIKKAIKSGDITKLNELTKRYASINPER